MDLKVPKEDYWKALYPIVYDDKDMVSRVDFKTFMRRHIKKALPAVYKNLLEGQKILEQEEIEKYLV